MTGTVLSVIMADQSFIVQNVGEFIIQSASLLQAVLKILFLLASFVRFARLI